MDNHLGVWSGDTSSADTYDSSEDL